MITTSAVLPSEPISTQTQQQLYAAAAAPTRTVTANAPAIANVAAAQPPAEAKSASTPAKPEKLNSSSSADINLRFRIDQKTQDITVYMLDRSTREVIRTIPPSELSKLTPGDLVSLFA